MLNRPLLKLKSSGLARTAARILCLATMLLVVVPPVIEAQVNLYSIANNNNNLRVINPSNGATLSSVAITLAGKTVTGGTGLATDPTTGTLWALVRTTTSTQCQTSARIPELVSINPSTGVATSVGSLADCFSGIAFRPDGTLYGVTGHGGDTPDTLYILNKTNATVTFVMSLADDGGQAIAFNSSNGLLYHGSGFSSNHFESINSQTLARSAISLSGFAYTEAAGLTYSHSESLFLMTDIGFNLSGSNFMSVTTGGVVTFRGSLDHFSKGLAFALVSCPGASLQTAIDNAPAGAAIMVSGICSQNILIRNEKQRITIDGAGAGPGTRATINGSAGSPTVNVRGKGILIQNLTITGGADGIYVNRGSNAVINNNIIQNTGGDGVIVDELAFTVLTNNTIQNNPGAGVFINESSTARIGFNSDTESAASPNTIQGNSDGGIIVSNGSSARVIGNTISGNTGDGVRVLRDSHADIASNAINSNTGDGVEVGENSIVQLGENSGSSIFESPNATTSLNTGVGIRCTAGGVADGRQGTLNGNGGTKSFADPTCIDSLN